VTTRSSTGRDARLSAVSWVNLTEVHHVGPRIRTEKHLMKKTTALLAASVLGVGGLALSAPAQAATDCTGTSQTKIISTGARPATVVVGTHVTRELTFFSQVEDPCTAAVSSAVLLENSPLSDDMEQVDRLGNVASFQVAYQIDPGDLANTDAGLWQADVAAQGTTEDHATASFRLLRATRLTTNAAPEPVRKGRTITVEGLLTRASWDTHTYRGVQRATVTLEGRGPHDTSYVPLRQVTSDTKGRLKVSLTARKDICFRFAYAGSGTTAPVTSAGDCVRLR
jgi:hypothetical protein